VKKKTKEAAILVDLGGGKWYWPLDSAVRGLEEWYKCYPNNKPVVSFPRTIPPSYVWMLRRYFTGMREPIRIEEPHGRGDGVVFEMECV
jgi:hypothetical protein